MEQFKAPPDQDLDWSLDPRILRKIFKKTKFDSLFAKHISKDVIKILSPQQYARSNGDVEPPIDEESIYENLILPIEKFICDLDSGASSDDVKKVLDNIESFNQPSKLCRRILKAGDVTFSCNDCGLDGTCVVCIDCFHKGAHKDHNYRMSNSDGGGCCDCGDIEAWKANYACKDHMATDETGLYKLTDFEDEQLRSKHIRQDKSRIIEKIGRLPRGIAWRYFLVCQASLHYALEVLTWQKYDSLPPYLEIKCDSTIDADLAHLLSKDSSSKNYFTVLFNDEVHTYDHVINTLVKIINVSKLTASIMASTVSREGKSLILNDNYNSCKHVKDMIASIRDTGQGPLKVDVIHGTILAHQAFALQLIAWIRKMTTLSDSFRILTAYTLFGSFSDSTDRTLVEVIMLSNTKYWKIARVEWNDLLVTSLLTEYSFKEQFARLITRIYPKLMKNFIKDDHDHSVSILTMTTQLYTVPSLTCMLIEEENALTIIAQTLIDTCRSTKRDNPTMNFENRNTFDMQNLKRGFYIITDLRHLISIQPTKWSEKLRNNVIEAVKIFLNLLDSMQGMDSVRRQLGQHLEYEPDWESGMTLQSRLINFITRLVTYCSFDEGVLVETLKETQARLFKNGGYKMITRKLFDHEVSCIQYDVSTSPVSVHLPLTRFAAALILELMRCRPCGEVPYDASLVILTDQKHSMIDIMEPSLRTEVMIAQFRSGMWRRNGYSLVNQILYFHGAHMRKEMFDRDILVLQECAATVESNKFMIHLLNKFQLFTWIRSETTREPLVGPKAVSFSNDEEIMAQTMSLGEEFLQLLLTIISERYRVGVGLVEEEDVIKNEIIQLLCISPSTRSDLNQKLYVNDNELDCIKSVANLKRSTEASTGKYELKDEFYDRFNPFFYHYSRRNQSNALDSQLKRKKNLKENLICCPPPKPVELTSQFSNLNRLLKCDISLILIQKILKRALGPPENSQECSTKAPIRFTASDLQLDQCLHLIGLGLYEQERDPLGFGYLEAAYSKEIFSLLKECYEKAKRSKDLIFWLMKKTYNLIEMIFASHSDSLDTMIVEVFVAIKDCFKSTLLACDTMKHDSKKRSSELAAQRRDRIMAMMKANQAKFLSSPSTKQLVAETEKNDAPNSANQNISTQSASSSQSNMSVYTTRSGRKTKPPKSISGFITNIHEKPSVQADSNDTTSNSSQLARGEDTIMDYESDDQMDSESVNMDEQNCLVQPPEPNHLCILCRDEQKIGFDQPTMVLLAYVQRSTVLSKNRRERRIPNYALTPSNQLKHQYLSKTHSKSGVTPDMYSFTSDNSWSFDATFMPSDLFFGPHISTCGHVMHYDCWRGFFDSITRRETNRTNRNARHVSFELEKFEILCPLCECISNATIPLLPNYTRFSERRKIPKHQSISIFAANPSVVGKSSDNLSACLHALRGTVDMFKHIRHIKDVSTNILINHEDKYIRLLQPRSINEVLEELGEAEALGLRDFINSVRSDKVSSNKCTKSLLNSISTLADRIHSVGLDLDGSVLDVNHARIFMMTSWSISYTIQAFERVARFKGSPLFEDLESSKNLCLSSLLRFACSSMMTHQSDVMQSLLVRKLRYLLINDEHMGSSPCCLDIDAFETFVSLLILLQKLYSHFDDTSQFNDELSTSNSSVSLRASEDQNYAWMTRAFDHEYFRNLLHLMLIFNMLQVVISMQNETSQNSVGAEESSSSADGDKEQLALYGFYKEILIASGHPNNKMPEPTDEFVTKIKARLLPFLRSCAAFFFHLSHIQPPQTLRTKSAFSEGKDFVQPQSKVTTKGFESVAEVADLNLVNEEFDAVCQYLDLPNNFHILLQSQEARHLARSWLRHSRVLILIKSALEEKEAEQVRLAAVTPNIGDISANRSHHHQQQQQNLKRVGSSSCSIQSAANMSISSASSLESSSQTSKTELMPVRLIRQPHRVNRLIDLPFDYSELVDQVSDFTCPSIKNEDSRTPTMCLICGLMLCSQSYCCQRDLNDLASNYQQILQSQQESRQAGASSTSANESVSAIQQATEGGHYLSGIMPPNAVAALSLMGSAAALLVSSTASTNSNSSSGSSSSGASTIHQQLVGSCTYHAHECSGGVGVFLRIRNCQILLLSGRSKGCYMPAPYIDDHGETDFGLMRGNPLHLNRQHYEKLQHMWLTHAIPEQISRTLEYSSYASSINWHLH